MFRSSSVENLEELYLAIDEPAPDRVIIARQELRRLQIGLDGLSERHRDAIVMRKVQGLSVREISQRAGIPEKSVERHLTEGMRILADILLRRSSRLGGCAMSNAPYEPPSKTCRADDIKKRASEFVLRQYDLEGWTDADDEALKAWLDESLSHRTAYWRLKSIWNRADRLDALRPMLPPRSPSGARSPLLRFKFAAAVALVSVLGASAWFPRPFSMQTFTTATGERRDLTLADGSHIELTTDTQLRLAGTSRHQNVWLDKGEAYFQIIHDPHREFVLHATKLRIVDLGTEFSVRRNSDRIQITVVKGSVEVESTDPQKRLGAVRLLPGEVAIASNGAINVAKKSPSQIDDSLTWRRGILVFDHMPLAKVASEFNRYNLIKIHIDGAAISTKTISARLPATDVSVFARMAQEFLGLQVTRTNTEIRISARNE